MSHMDMLKMKFTVGNCTTKWLEKGIMAGCTISVVLFVAAINLLLKQEGRGVKRSTADDGTRHQAYWAFMDDMTDDHINPGIKVDPECTGKDSNMGT